MRAEGSEKLCLKKAQPNLFAPQTQTLCSRNAIWRVMLSNDKKERIEQFYFRTENKVSSISVTYDSEREGFILPSTEKGSVVVEKSYERKSGKPKVLCTVHTDRDFASFEINKMLTKEYTYIVSIDTNTKILNDKKISICTCYFVPGNISQHKNGIPFYHLVSYLINNPKNNINPEKIGWSLVININLKHSLPLQEDRLAIIVDSEKDSLSKFNNMKEPYIENNYLPEQFFFSYASDKDKDTLSGQMIKMCHNVANQLYRKIEQGNFSFPPFANGNNLHDGYCELKMT